MSARVLVRIWVKSAHSGNMGPGNTTRSLDTPFMTTRGIQGISELMHWDFPFVVILGRAKVRMYGPCLEECP